VVVSISIIVQIRVSILAGIIKITYIKSHYIFALCFSSLDIMQMLEFRLTAIFEPLIMDLQLAFSRMIFH